jgi:DNA-binding MarR family transcriptional regulator
MIPDFELLERLGLTQYERRALLALLRRGIADAVTLCEEGDVPSSKIYLAMEKLSQMGLVQIQPSRPRLFAAMSAEEVVERLGEIAREQANAFAVGARGLLDLVRENPVSASGRPFSDLALGVDAHVRRHLVHLAAARKSIVSYLEESDLAALRRSQEDGFHVLRKIGRNAEERGVACRIVFGFGHRDAPRLVEFLSDFRIELRSVTGVRYSGLLGHPFHVVDGETVILSLDNPFLQERRFASLMVRSPDLAGALAAGFEGLWSRAMKSLREIDVHPDAGRGR